MATITQHAPGTFCWPELGTTDQAAAKTFYSSLFGWTTEDIPMDAGATYTMLRQGGKDVGALYALGAQQQGMPPHWGSYVAVESADAAAAKAKQLGGTVVAEPFDVFDIGRMAVLQDPSGAIVSVWQAKKHLGAGVLDEPGALCWSELLTKDTAKAGPFYTQMFGWSSEIMPMEQPYTVFKNQGTPAAGMMAIDASMGDMPSAWMTYFGVENCAASAEKAKQLGAQVLVPPTPIPNIGTFAVLMDPQGAAFSIIEQKR